MKCLTLIFLLAVIVERIQCLLKALLVVFKPLKGCAFHIGTRSQSADAVHEVDGASAHPSADRSTGVVSDDS